MSYPVAVALSTSQHVDKDELFVCPFDPVHRISAKRFVYHFHKCRKQHLHVETATCPFNARHIVLKPELRHHTSTCPDRRLVEVELHNLAADSFNLQNDHLPVSSEVLFFPGDDEFWDDEVEQTEKKTSEPASVNSGFSSGVGGKKVNTRREAIKKMKEEMRRKMEEDGELHSRRPQNMTMANQAAETILQQTQKKGFLPKRTSDDGATNLRAKIRPRLAPNFNFNVDSASGTITGGVGRGWHISQNKENPTSVNVQNGIALNNGPCKQYSSAHAIGRGRHLLQSQALSLPRYPMPDRAIALRNAKLCLASTNPHPNAGQALLDMYSASSTDSDASGDCVDLGKRERKMRKQLKQIEALEEKIKAGLVLNNDEAQKVQKKDELLRALQRAEAQDGC